MSSNRRNWLLLAAACLGASASGQDAVVPGHTLPADAAVTVDLRAKQEDGERAEARRRAQIVASMPGAKEREALVPEIRLIERTVLANTMVVASEPEVGAQNWRMNSAAPAEVLAERVIIRLLAAGFSTAPHCKGEEWSGRHGANRVAVRVGKRDVTMRLEPASRKCADPGA